MQLMPTEPPNKTWGPFHSPLCLFMSALGVYLVFVCLTVVLLHATVASVPFYFFSFVELIANYQYQSDLSFCYITIKSYHSGSPSFSTRPSLIILLFPQFRGHNCGTRRGAGSRAELRIDGGSVGQRPDASQTVVLPSRWLLHPHVCHPLGFSHSLSLFL